MELHHPTLFLAIVTGFTMLAVLLSFAQRGALGRDPVIWIWTLGTWCCVVSYVAILLRDVIPLYVSVLLANAGSEFGVTLFAASLHRFLLGREPPRWLWSLCAVQLLVLAVVFPMTQPIRVTVVTFSHLLLVTPMLWWLHRAGPPRESMLVAVRFTLQLAEGLLLFRFLDSAVHPQLYDVGAVQGWRQGLVYASAYLSLLGTGFGFALANLERKALRLNELASLDPLTGCLNRRAGDERVDLAAAECLGKGWPMTLVLLDLDHFKQVNDRHGHHCGDRALQRFAAIVRGEAGEGALLVRLGGEEFALWLPGQAVADAASVAERVRAAVAAAGLLDAQGQPVALTVSAGVAGGPLRPVLAGVGLVDGLYAQADRALYRAKAAGRNRVETEQVTHLGGELVVA